MKEKFDIEKILKTTMKNCNYFYNKEEGFRIDIVNAIKEVYANSFVICEYAIEGCNKSIDIVIEYDNKKYAIELKYRPNVKKDKYKKHRTLKYKISKGNNLYEYITDDINKKMLNKEIVKNEEFKNFYAIMLTDYKRFDSTKKVLEYCGKRNNTYLKEPERIIIKKIDIENGPYRETGFYLICASLKQ